MINVGSQRIANIIPNGFITTRGNKDDKVLYLTFDDGPNDLYTTRVCDLLEQFDAVGSFFCIGQNLERHPEIAKNLTDRGHLIANHSDTHDKFRQQKLVTQIQEAESCQSRILKLNPSSRKIFRAPQADLDIFLMCKLLSRKWNLIHWSYDSLDYKHKTVDYYLELFENKPVKNGDILLFHDDNSLCLEILELMLPIWKNLNFEFKSVDRLLSQDV